MNAEIKQYWDKAHINNLTSKLSGNGKETIRLLLVEDEFLNSSHILNIGVGTGAFEEYIHESGRTVDSLDISEKGLEKVEQTARYRYLNPTALPTGQYDLVTELQVALHLTDDEMERHIFNAIRSLNGGGLYAFNAPSFLEYSEDTRKNVGNENPSVSQMFCGYALCRSISWYAKTIRKHQGQIVKVELLANNKEKNVATYIYHVRKRSERVKV